MDPANVTEYSISCAVPMPTKYTHGKISKFLIIVDGLINCKIGVRNPVTQDVRSTAIRIILGKNIIIVWYKFVLVFVSGIFEIVNPFKLSGISPSVCSQIFRKTTLTLQSM